MLFMLKCQNGRVCRTQLETIHVFITNLDLSLDLWKKVETQRYSAIPNFTFQHELKKGFPVCQQAPPLFDHCQFDTLASTPAWKRESFVKAIFKMDIQNPEHEEVMRLEGIQKKWMPPRQEGYVVVSKALGSKRSFSSVSHAVGHVGIHGTSSHFGHFGLLRRLQCRHFGQVRNFSSKPTVGVVGARLGKQGVFGNL